MGSVLVGRSFNPSYEEHGFFIRFLLLPHNALNLSILLDWKIGLSTRILIYVLFRTLNPVLCRVERFVFYGVVVQSNRNVP
jgi:hypothetical protein